MDGKRPVIVTTEFRGVFFGYLESEDEKGRVSVLSDAKNCISWSADIHGFGGLAVTGPNDKCRIGPAIKKIKLHSVTAILDCTKEAEKAWKKEIL